MRRRPATPPECPVCGAKLTPGDRACPECGADERTGWNEEDTRYDGLDLPDSAFDDDNSSSPRPPLASRSRQLFWTAVGVVLIVLFVYSLFRGLF
jgi:uncharacterized membrane protein YvbJ